MPIMILLPWAIRTHHSKRNIADLKAPHIERFRNGAKIAASPSSRMYRPELF